LGDNQGVRTQVTFPCKIWLAASLVLLVLPIQLEAQVEGLGQTLPDAAEVLVFKKWIGATGQEAAVEIELTCQGLDEFHALRVNEDRPDGWLIADIPPGGRFCSVHEERGDSYTPDESDCRNLLVLPGSSVECTLVNTKRVKRIEMLNRYGIVMMIALVFGAGLAAVHRQLH
jgi:hypothetical protein